ARAKCSPMVRAVDQLSSDQLLDIGQALLAFHGQPTRTHFQRTRRTARVQDKQKQDDGGDGNDDVQVNPRERLVRYLLRCLEFAHAPCLCHERSAVRFKPTADLKLSPGCESRFTLGFFRRVWAVLMNRRAIKRL